MTEQRREAEALREREREAALRAWLNESAPDAVPPSLARTVASVTSRPHPASARRERGAVAWLPGSRVTLLRAVAALAAVALVAVTTGVLVAGLRGAAGGSPSPMASGQASAIAASASPSPSSDAFRVNADEAAAISTVERFIHSINAGDINGVQALVAQDAGGSDCDYIQRTVVVFIGKPSVMQWLRAHIADHDRLTVGSIFNANEVFTPVVGVEFANRSSDTLARLGFPGGVVPSLSAKVVLTPDMTQVGGFNLGPGGADPGTIASACSPA
jgi:hypothetical protein